jgi:hypothetical protein
MFKTLFRDNHAIYEMTILCSACALTTGVYQCVWSRNLEHEAALAHVRLLRQKQEKKRKIYEHNMPRMGK